MGLKKNESIVYLRVSDGKIRLKTNEKDPEAVQRQDEINNKILFERVYSSCSGYLLEVREQTHDEYGTSYSIIIFDPSDNTTYSLQFSDQTRYFPAFVQRLPNIDFSIPVTIKPYSFTKDGRNNIGLSIEQSGQKVANYYKKWDAKEEVSYPINGLEAFDFQDAAGDKDELKILRIKLIKFMKKELKTHNEKLVKFWEKNPKPVKSELESGLNEPADIPAEEISEEENLPEASSKKKKKLPVSKRKKVN